MLGLVAEFVSVAGPVAAAGFEQIGRVAINQLGAGEGIPAQKAEGVACLEPESGLAVGGDGSSSYGFDGLGVFVGKRRVGPTLPGVQRVG
ncbi:MAG: hypothetical protein JO012_18375 [Hyphomicrobiales bacterium]|nr:hypothetical protein [Hyphomicrobiales bacterium]